MTAKTTFILEADEAQVVGALLKIVDAQKKTADGSREITRASNETSKSFLGMDGSLKGVVGMLGVGGGIAGGITFLRGQTQAWTAEVQELIGKFTGVNKELVKAVSQAGDLANLPEIQERLKTISMPGIGPVGKMDIYKSLRGELPLESFETIMKLLPEAGKATIFEDPKEFAARMGTTFKIYKGELKPDDVADTAKIVGDLLGTNREKYGGIVFREAEKLRAMNMDADQALAIPIAAAYQGQLRGLRSLDTLLTAEKTFERRKPGQRFTEQEKTEREFYAIENPLERLNWLKANRGKGGKAADVLQDQGALEAISEVDTNAIAERIKKAREIDYFEKTRRIAVGTEPGATISLLENAEALKEKTEVEAGGVLAETNIARDMLKTSYLRYVRERIPIMSAPWMYGLSRGLLETEIFLGVPQKAALEMNPLVQGYGPMPGALTPQETKQSFTKETIDKRTLEENTKALKDLTKILLNNQGLPLKTISFDSGMLD
jgi:hypothetical protein